MDKICIGDKTSLFRLQSAVLEGIATALDAGRDEDGAEGAPTRRFVAIGDPVFDCCPQLTVHATNIRMTPDNIDVHGYRMCTGEYLVDITAVLLRCYPSSPDVKPDDLNEFGRILSLDAAWMFWGFECALINNSVLVTDECHLKAPGVMNPVTPQAGCGGWTWTWTFVIPSC